MGTLYDICVPVTPSGVLSILSVVVPAAESDGKGLFKAVGERCDRIHQRVLCDSTLPCHILVEADISRSQGKASGGEKRSEEKWRG